MDALGKSLEDAEFKVKSNDNNIILKATMYWVLLPGERLNGNSIPCIINFHNELRTETQLSLHFIVDEIVDKC